MRNILCGFILGIFALASVRTALAQPDTLWSQRLSEDVTILYGAVAIPDGFVVVGYAQNGSQKDILAARLSSVGQVIWTTYLGTTRDEEGWGVAQADDGNFIIAGFGVDPTQNRNEVVLAALSADGDSLWWRRYGSSGQTKARDLVKLPDGNFGVVGYMYNGSSSDVWLLKCDAEGDTLWTRTFGGDQTDTGYRLQVRPNGGFVLVGTTRSFGGGLDDPWVIFTNAQGQNAINYTLGDAGSEFANAVTVDMEGNSYVGGRGSQGEGPPLVAMFDVNGQQEWSYYYAEEPLAEVKGVVPRPIGGVMCFGANDQGGTHGWLMGVNSEGIREWSWELNVPSSEFHGVVPAMSGGALAFGRAGNDGYVLRFGTSAGVSGVILDNVDGLPEQGVYINTVGIGSPAVSDVNGRFLIERPPATYTLYAYGPCVQSETFGSVEVFADSIVEIELEIGVPNYERIQSSVNITAYNHQQATGQLYVPNIGGGEMNFSVEAVSSSPPGNWLSVEPAAGTVAAGETLAVSVIVLADTTDDGVYDFYGQLFLHTNSCPDSTDYFPVLITVLDAGVLPQVPREFAFHAAYPNPFNPQTTLAFDLPRAADVQLIVYDVTGREVRRLVETRLDAGRHTVGFDGVALSSGIYFARLSCDDFVAQQKLLLVK